MNLSVFNSKDKTKWQQKNNRTYYYENMLIAMTVLHSCDGTKYFTYIMKG